MAGIMRTYDEVEDIGIRRECVLKGLITFLGEDAKDLIKEYCGSSGDDAQMELKQLTMAAFVIRKEGEGLKELPEDIDIVIEGVEMLHDLTSVASACALLLGLIYALIQRLCASHLKCSKKSSCNLSSTRCLPKFRICLEDFRPHSKETGMLCNRTDYLLSSLFEQKSAMFWKLNNLKKLDFLNFLWDNVHVKATSNTEFNG